MLAFTMAPGRGDTDLLLEGLALQMAARGLRCCGTVQINTARADDRACDMDVRVLPDGPVLRISQDRGPGARGCRLDPGALETAVAMAARRLASGADLLIVNKFGKHEAEGRGFRDVIAEALSRDVPVLVGLNALNRAAFEAFADGQALSLPPDRRALAEWVVSVRDRRAERV
jgi:nucleoside-triphosphatase THEP1